MVQKLNAKVPGERVITVTMTLFLQILKGTALRTFRVLTPLPDDVAFVRAGYDEYGRVNVIVQSKEWPELEIGAPIPPIEVRFETVQQSEPVATV
jgi:hypothetical protein